MLKLTSIESKMRWMLVEKRNRECWIRAQERWELTADFGLFVFWRGWGRRRARPILAIEDEILSFHTIIQSNPTATCASIHSLDPLHLAAGVSGDTVVVDSRYSVCDRNISPNSNANKRRVALSNKTEARQWKPYLRTCNQFNEPLCLCIPVGGLQHGLSFVVFGILVHGHGVCRDFERTFSF